MDHVGCGLVLGPDGKKFKTRSGTTEKLIDLLNGAIDRAKQLLKVQADFGGFYNGNSAKLILSEVQREHGQDAVDQLIRELQLDRIFGFEPGTRFEGGLAMGK